MHVERDVGYVGLADGGGGLTNVSLVVPPPTRAHVSAAIATAFLERWLRARPQLAPRFARARARVARAGDGPVRVARAAGVGAGRRARRRRGRLLRSLHRRRDLRGAARRRDARAVRAAGARRAPSHATPIARCARYDRARRKEFGGKWIVERLIGAAVGYAPPINYFARTLEARKDMADLLVGVTGDFVPAREVLRPGYLLNLFRHSNSTPAPGS